MMVCGVWICGIPNNCLLFIYILNLLSWSFIHHVCKILKRSLYHYIIKLIAVLTTMPGPDESLRCELCVASADTHRQVTNLTPPPPRLRCCGLSAAGIHLISSKPSRKIWPCLSSEMRRTVWTSGSRFIQLNWNCKSAAGNRFILIRSQMRSSLKKKRLKVSGRKESAEHPSRLSRCRQMLMVVNGQSRLSKEHPVKSLWWPLVAAIKHDINNVEREKTKWNKSWLCLKAGRC